MSPLQHLKDSLTRLILTPFVWRYTAMPGRSFEGNLPRMRRAQELIAANCRRYVRHLAEEIGDCSLRNPDALEKAACFIQTSFRQIGYEPVAHPFVVGGNAMRNIAVEIKGRTCPERILVIGAHYDSIGPGADDNATGVAALLELARLFRFAHLDCTVRFVAFANEEESGYTWQDMGSYHYARQCRDLNEDIIGMISLEMLGYFSDDEGSQHYPRPFNLFYPRKGNFVGFVGNYASRAFVRKAIASFRKHARFPSHGVAAPESLRDIGRSDHWGFWQMGYSGFMLTDTSNFRYQHYHSGQDTPDKVDFYKLARIVDGMTGVILDFATDR